jgi:glucokinase
VKVLAGDVGGTNARLAIVDVTDAGVSVVHQRRFGTQGTTGLAPIVLRYLTDVGTTPEHACFGIACPIVDGDCRTPNLPWTVNAAALATDIGIAHTTIVNDFDAIGYGLARLGPSDLVTLQVGSATPHGTIAVIGAGTGLGQGFLVWDGERYRVHPSEGGHVNFAARDEIEWGLRQSLLDEFGHVSYERVLSGSGLVRVYRYLAASGFAPERPETRLEMDGEDAAAVVSRHGLAGDDALAVRALDIFAAVLGSQAGNLALTVLATGGVYVAGGIAPQIVGKLADGTFVAAFGHKGRLSELAARIPIHVIMSPDVGLLGAAEVAARR